MRETAIYVRQSADRADSVSLETQEALCRQELADGTAVRVYSDRGYSGKNTERPALRTLMAAVRADQIDRVLVYKLDRISRNLADFTQLLREFEAHRVEFCSHTERFETASPMGQAMQSLLMVFAQLERETISGRVRDAAFSRAKMGFDTGGPPPVGFRKIPSEILGKRTQILSPDADAPRISAAFTAYLAAENSLSDICRTWNHAGFLTRRGSEWYPHTVCRVLRNPVYAQADSHVYAYLSSRGAALCIPETLPERHGVYLYADRRINRSRFTDLHGVFAICAPHEGLVPPEVWLGCQQKLDASRRKRTHGSGEKTWLSGSIFCMRCGSAMTAVRGRHADYLICGGKKRGKCGGAGAVWRVETAEALAGAVLAEQLTVLQETGGAQPADDRQTQLRQALEALNLRREALLRQMTDPEGGAPALLSEAAERLAARQAALTAELAASERPRQVQLPAWQTCSAAMRKTIAQTLLRCIMTDGETLHMFLK